MSKINPINHPLKGALRVPGDKSVSHRAVILGSLCEGETVIDNFAPGADNRSTIAVFRALGVEITADEESRQVRVHGKGPDGLKPSSDDLDCGNSGTTIRLVSGLLAGLGLKARLIGDASLSRRPMGRIVKPLTAFGASIEAGDDGYPPVVVHEKSTFHGGTFDLPVASAQVKSSLLLAALGAGQSMLLHEPSASRNHTEVMLRYLGVSVRSSEHYTHPWKGGRLDVFLGAHTEPISAKPITVPGDISSAAFLMVAAAIVPDSRVVLEACGMAPTRAGVLEALESAGVRFTARNVRRLEQGNEPVADITVEAGGFKAFDIASDAVPRLIDEIPVLAVLAGRAEGTTTFHGVDELKVKETDRLAKTVELLEACGRTVEVDGDILRVTGDPTTPFKAFTYNADHDHRMAAAAVIASLVADGPCTIEGLDSLAISYPGLVDDLKSLNMEEEA